VSTPRWKVKLLSSHIQQCSAPSGACKHGAGHTYICCRFTPR
jgi:hypothetical protein